MSNQVTSAQSRKAINAPRSRKSPAPSQEKRKPLKGKSQKKDIDQEVFELLNKAKPIETNSPKGIYEKLLDRFIEKCIEAGRFENENKMLKKQMAKLESGNREKRKPLCFKKKKVAADVIKIY
ncbi:MAG: hypothetical protein KKE59_09630 [Proteobacteria bacterium]|nr:hypothetical protein [Pseudomonadota bacterium]